MRREVIIAIGVFVAACVGSSFWMSPVPSIKDDRYLVDFGTQFAPTSDLKCEFEVRNSSEIPMELETLNKSCSCTSVTIPNPVISPGKSGVVRFIWELSDSPGPQGVQVTVSGPNGKPVFLKAKCEVRDNFSVQPIRARENLYPNQEASITFTIRAPFDGDETIDKLTLLDNDDLDVEIKRVSSNEATVYIRATGKQNHGNSTHEIVIGTASERQPKIPLEVELVHLGQYVSTPASLLIGFSESGAFECSLEIERTNRDETIPSPIALESDLIEIRKFETEYISTSRVRINIAGNVSVPNSDDSSVGGLKVLGPGNQLITEIVAVLARAND